MTSHMRMSLRSPLLMVGTTGVHPALRFDHQFEHTSDACDVEDWE